MSEFQESTLMRGNEINDKLYSRNVPSDFLKPSLSAIPVSTKYTTMPILDQRRKPEEELNTYSHFSTNEIFNPGNSKSPWDGFVSNVNLESHLRNQFFALQKSDKAVYVPSSESELYNAHVVASNIEQNHPMLFDNTPFNEFNPNTLNLGKDNFNNNTRIQLKNLK